MSDLNQDPLNAMRILNALPEGADYVDATGDVDALKVIIRDATSALDVLRRHHVAVTSPVDEHAVSGNGHSH